MDAQPVGHYGVVVRSHTCLIETVRRVRSARQYAWDQAMAFTSFRRIVGGGRLAPSEHVIANRYKASVLSRDPGPGHVDHASTSVGVSADSSEFIQDLRASMTTMKSTMGVASWISWRGASAPGTTSAFEVPGDIARIPDCVSEHSDDQGCGRESHETRTSHVAEEVPGGVVGVVGRVPSERLSDGFPTAEGDDDNRQAHRGGFPSDHRSCFDRSRLGWTLWPHTFVVSATQAVAGYSSHR